VLKLCRAEACQSVNGERLARQFLDRFGVEWGGTTPDGRLTIEATYCLGLCASGPSAMLDGEVMGRLTPESIDDVAREVG
jgi:formate dehydrogenase subunit gamma